MRASITDPRLGRARRLAAATLVIAGLAVAPGTAFAQTAPDITETEGSPPEGSLADGSLVFHGNYCGPGNRGAGLAPVDALDAACMHHDACSPAFGHGLPPCSCNARLHREASLVAHDPRTADDVRAAADFVALGAGVLRCRR